MTAAEKVGIAFLHAKTCTGADNKDGGDAAWRMLLLTHIK